MKDKLYKYEFSLYDLKLMESALHRTLKFVRESLEAAATDQERSFYNTKFSEISTLIERISAPREAVALADKTQDPDEEIKDP